MSKIKPIKIQRKATESQVAASLCKMLQIPRRPTVEDVCHIAGEMHSGVLQTIASMIDHMYAWSCDVTDEVMRLGNAGQMYQELAQTPGNVAVVHDNQRSTVDAVWLVSVDPPDRMWRLAKENTCRALMRTVESSPGRTSVVLAIQMSTISK